MRARTAECAWPVNTPPPTFRGNPYSTPTRYRRPMIEIFDHRPPAPLASPFDFQRFSGQFYCSGFSRRPFEHHGMSRFGSAQNPTSPGGRPQSITQLRYLFKCVFACARGRSLCGSVVVLPWNLPCISTSSIEGQRGLEGYATAAWQLKVPLLEC